MCSALAYGTNVPLLPPPDASWALLHQLTLMPRLRPVAVTVVRPTVDRKDEEEGSGATRASPWDPGPGDGGPAAPWLARRDGATARSVSGGEVDYGAPGGTNGSPAGAPRSSRRSTA